MSNPIHELVRDELAKHDIGCTCSLCAFVRNRFPSADASHPDRFEGQGGAHESYPFDATNTVQLQSLAKSALAVSSALDRIASAVESVRDVLRGRDAEDKPIKGPLRAMADALIQRATQQASPPATQRTPPDQQAQAAPAQPAQANPYAKAKRIATDAEMARFKSDQKARFDPKNWPGESFKGRMLIECDPSFLDLYADQIEWFAGKAKEKVAAGTADDSAKREAQWGELNAAQYRRLAQDMRAGIVQRQVAAPVVGPANQSWD